MISEKSLEYLEKSIPVFDNLSDKRYLVCYKQEDKIKYLELQIDHTHFWHLLGCRLKENLSLIEKEFLYQSVLNRNYDNKNIVLESLDYTHTFKEVEEKFNAFIKNFDFVKNGKILDIKNTDNTPEYNLFQYMIGSSSGIIGYKEAKEYKNIYIPNSSQKKSIYKNASPFVLILSKDFNKYGYDKIEYTITKKKDYIKEIISNIPSKYKVLVYINENEALSNKKVVNHIGIINTTKSQQFDKQAEIKSSDINRD